jgi:hypothetical protein
LQALAQFLDHLKQAFDKTMLSGFFNGEAVKMFLICSSVPKASETVKPQAKGWQEEPRHHD